MNEIVKYDIELNRLDYSLLNGREQNIFMSILAKVKNNNTDKVALPYDEIITLSNLKSSHLDDKQKYDLIESTKTKLFNISCDIPIDDSQTGPTSISFHVFDTWVNSYPSKCLTLSISPIFTKFLNNPEKFLAFPLTDFVNLSSNYSKTLYRILKQFDSLGTYKFHTITQFRDTLHVPESMPNKKIKALLEQCVSEINKKGYIKNLTYIIEKDTNKKGCPMKAIILKWD